MFKRLRAWIEQRRAVRDAREYEAGRRWAHREIIFGIGYGRVENAFITDMYHHGENAFRRGVMCALAEHADAQHLLGRDVHERVALARTKSSSARIK